VGGAHLMQKALNDIEQNQRLNSLSGTRLELITQALDGSRNAINGLDTKALIAVNSDNADLITSVSNEAEASLRSAMTALSSKHGSRNLLSGDATDTAPFAGADALLSDIRAIMTANTTPATIDAALDNYFDDPLGGFQTTQYLGGTNAAPPLRLSDGSVIQVDIRGDNQVIKDALRGLAVIATAADSGFPSDSPGFMEIYQNGITSTADGVAGLIAMQGDMGVYSETIDKANARDQFENLTLTAAYQAIIGRDQFEAAAELQQLQVQLEASYVITSRLASLTLTNFVR
ncbi:MAG: hypothetical protein EX271_04920, partial [Acidimicrobiales bacterium]